MPATIISDTSCLILLNKIGELNLLEKIFGEIVTTQAVAKEFGGDIPNWIRIQDPRDIVIQHVLETNLDKGEASAIALALEMVDALLIIDEVKGRKIARRLGLNITGTLGILVQAKRNRHILLLKPLLDRIEQTDFRLSEQLLQEVLKEAGE